MALIKQSERAAKCKYCGMRGRAGTPEALYWFKDSETGHFVLLHEDGHKHTETCTSSRSHSAPITTTSVERPASIPEPVSPFQVVREIPGEPTIPTEPTNGASKQLVEALRAAIGTTTVDETQVRSIIQETYGEQLQTISDFVTSKVADLNVPTRVEIFDKATGETRELEGVTHQVFPTVLKALQCGVHVWLVGPAGTGKSVIAHQCAEALQVPFGSISLTVTTPVSEIVGYRDATGTYHDTSFRRIYEGGGVFLWDECDNGNANTLGKTNEALANGSMEFPDKRVPKHPDCYIIAAANTFGTGADRQYVGRMQLDAAFLDRFAAHIQVPVDEALEETVARSQGAPEYEVTALLAKVRALRLAADRMRLPVVISPRASIFGAKLIAGGFTLDQVITMTIRKGISESDWSKLNG